MNKTYQVVGRYPSFRPLAIGTEIPLSEEAARYHVLAGTLKPVTATEDAPLPVADTAPAKRKVGDK